MALWERVESSTITHPKAKALEFAAKHANLPKSPVERLFSEDHRNRLIGIIKEGNALPFDWATVEFEGQLMRMNGQHSSHAIVEVGAELVGPLTFHYDRYKTATRKGMVELFRQFDQRWQARMPKDVANAYQGLIPELAAEDVSRPLMKLAAEAIGWHMKFVEGVKVPKKDDIYDLLHHEDNLAFLLWVNGIYNNRKELTIKPILAAMYKTHETSPAGATKFWREVSFGTDYFTDDTAPGGVLINELVNTFEDKTYKENEFSTPAIYYKKAIKAWNAFCAGQRITSLKVATKSKGWPEPASFTGGEEAA